MLWPHSMSEVTTLRPWHMRSQDGDVMWLVAYAKRIDGDNSYRSRPIWATGISADWRIISRLLRQSGAYNNVAMPQVV